jgi:hypothetical protein
LHTFYILYADTRRIIQINIVAFRIVEEVFHTKHIGSVEAIEKEKKGEGKADSHQRVHAFFDHHKKYTIVFIQQSRGYPLLEGLLCLEHSSK